MTLRSSLSLLPLLAASLAACAPHVEGNGVYAERAIDVSRAPFTQVTIGLPGVDANGATPDAFISASEPERQVVLSGDENVIEHIRVEIDASGTLRTSMDVHSYTAVHPPELHIKAQAGTLLEVEAVAGAGITVLDAAAPTFHVTAADHGHVSLSGGGGHALVVVLSGAAALEAAAYPVASVQLALSGASHATVSASDELVGSALGGSGVLVTGGAPCGGGLALDAISTCGPLP